MAKRIAVVSTYGDRPTGELLKKSVAELQVRRLLADWVVKGASIRLRPIREINLAALPRERMTRPYRRPANYQHHIEPKLIATSPQNSEYMRYLEGWDWSGEQALAG
jgi:hypothetical protein